MEYERSNEETAAFKDTVAEKRRYNILNVQDARNITGAWLASIELQEAIQLGLPEIDDRYHVWRVPLVGKDSGERVGEVVIDAYTSLLLKDKSTAPEVLEARLLKRTVHKQKQPPKSKTKSYKPSNLRNTIAAGDVEKVLQDFPEES
ncbi:MAG: hypothetical protein IAE79_18250, partial [Anaerolinea sp.]|nr:hypothetical protein [Anaerolinea sp.]